MAAVAVLVVTKTMVATAMAGVQPTINNQLKVVAVTDSNRNGNSDSDDDDNDNDGNSGGSGSGWRWRWVALAMEKQGCLHCH